MSHDMKTILAQPEDFGFDFVTENVRSGDVTYQGVPILRVQDAAKFEASFPGVILKALDGSSIRVSSQRVVREARDKNATIKTDELKSRLVMWLLGVRAPSGQRIVYAGPEGKTFSTEQEAQAAWLEWAAKQ